MTISFICTFDKEALSTILTSLPMFFLFGSSSSSNSSFKTLSSLPPSLSPSLSFSLSSVCNTFLFLSLWSYPNIKACHPFSSFKPGTAKARNLRSAIARYRTSKSFLKVSNRKSRTIRDFEFMVLENKVFKAFYKCLSISGGRL